MLNTILKDIAVKTLKIVLFAPSLLDENWEVSKILPFYWVTWLYFTYGFQALKPTLYKLSDQISFINIDHESLKLACDWCSLCNGLIETAKINMVANPALIEVINFKKLAVINTYLNFALSGRKTRVTQRQATQWCIMTFNKVTPDLLIFAEIYLNLELLERRWCPFKRSKEFYYRNKDPRFLSPDRQTIHAVGQILAQHETITCNNCPRVVNQHYKSNNNYPSIFDDFLKYMLNDIENI